jgi:hypothetical protein
VLLKIRLIGTSRMEKAILIFAKFSTNKILLAALRIAIIAVCLSASHLMAQKGICIAHAECQSKSDTNEVQSPLWCACREDGTPDLG